MRTDARFDSELEQRWAAERRGVVAPPAAARVQPATQARETWADAEDTDDELEEDDNGAAVPMTPSGAATLAGDDDSATGYSPTSTASSVQMHQLLRREDEDVAAAAHVCEADEILQLSILETNAEILQVVEKLGADTGRYRRERGPVLKRLVADVYSRPRVTWATALIPGLGLLVGFAVDLTTVNKSRENLHFTIESMRQEARALLAATRPALLIGSPPCTDFCAWQTLNAARLAWAPAEVRRRRAAGEVHVRFYCEFYADQIKNARLVLHEHLDSASSWKLKIIQETLAEESVDVWLATSASMDKPPPEETHSRRALGG